MGLVISTCRSGWCVQPVPAQPAPRDAVSATGRLKEDDAMFDARKPVLCLIAQYMQ